MKRLFNEPILQRIDVLEALNETEHVLDVSMSPTACMRLTSLDNVLESLDVYLVEALIFPKIDAGSMLSLEVSCRKVHTIIREYKKKVAKQHEALALSRVKEGLSENYVRERLTDLVKRFNGVVAGGYALMHFLGKSWGGDVDVFLPKLSYDQKAELKYLMAEYFAAKLEYEELEEYTPRHLGRVSREEWVCSGVNVSIVFSFASIRMGKRLPMQLIFTEAPSAKQFVLKNFDLSCCKCITDLQTYFHVDKYWHTASYKSFIYYDVCQLNIIERLDKYESRGITFVNKK